MTQTQTKPQAFSPLTDQPGAARFTYNRATEVVLELLPLPHDTDRATVELVKPKGVFNLVVQNRRCGDWYAEANERHSVCRDDYRVALRDVFAKAVQS